MKVFIGVLVPCLYLVNQNYHKRILHHSTWLWSGHQRSPQSRFHPTVILRSTKGIKQSWGRWIRQKVTRGGWGQTEAKSHRKPSNSPGLGQSGQPRQQEIRPGISAGKLGTRKRRIRQRGKQVHWTVLIRPLVVLHPGGIINWLKEEVKALT